MSEVRSVALNLTGRELIFLQKVTRQEYHFITDEEQEARRIVIEAAVSHLKEAREKGNKESGPVYEELTRHYRQRLRNAD